MTIWCAVSVPDIFSDQLQSEAVVGFIPFSSVSRCLCFDWEKEERKD